MDQMIHKKLRSSRVWLPSHLLTLTEPSFPLHRVWDSRDTTTNTAFWVSCRTLPSESPWTSLWLFPCPSLLLTSFLFLDGHSFSLPNLCLFSLPPSFSSRTFPMDHITISLDWKSYQGVDKRLQRERVKSKWVKIFLIYFLIASIYWVLDSYQAFYFTCAISVIL